MGKLPVKGRKFYPARHLLARLARLLSHERPPSYPKLAEPGDIRPVQSLDLSGKCAQAALGENDVAWLKIADVLMTRPGRSVNRFLSLSVEKTL